MTKGDWLDLTVLERKKYNFLSETLDLSQQMGEAMDRNDQVSLRMLVAMRQDPIRHLEEINQTALDRRESLAEEDQERVKALLAGAEGRTAEERLFLEQVQKARRLLERVVELDRRLNHRLTFDWSATACSRGELPASP